MANFFPVNPTKYIELRASNPQSEPLDSYTLNQTYFLTLEDQPLYTPTRVSKDGTLYASAPPFPFAIAITIPVEEFGNVTLYADNQGKGYTAEDFPLDLNLACAATRWYRVKCFMENARGVVFPPNIKDRVDKAKSYLDNAMGSRSYYQKNIWCYKSLSESLWAGEEAVIFQAKQLTIPREDFLFGGNFFGYPRLGERYLELFTQLFNYATIPLYWKDFEPERGHKNFTLLDSMVRTLRTNKITPKGHPLVWFHEIGIPQWLKGKSYSQVQKMLEARILDITSYYRGRIDYYDVINEPHGISWANDFNYSLEQLVETTHRACVAAKKGNPDIVRIINNCCLWGENVAYYPPPQHTPYEYLQACIREDIPFEVIGLQLYYPNQDLFEINRLIERFGRLGKTLHITELGVSSSYQEDPHAITKKPIGLWHAPWSESVQAEWVEKFYTLCYSKSYIKAISWWDLIDNAHFWPHGGLVDVNFHPKKSFDTLRAWINCDRTNN